MNERERKRKERERIMDDLNVLFLLNNSGWPVDKFIRECGRQLVPDSRFDYMPEGMTFEDLEYYLRIAKRHNVPARVFKDRLRLGKDPMDAATKPFRKKDPKPKKQETEG